MSYESKYNDEEKINKDRYRRNQRWPRHDYWPSKFHLKKHHYLKLKIIREPWTYPMGAINLAAMQIQRTWRGVSVRSLFRSMETKSGIHTAIKQLRNRPYKLNYRRTIQFSPQQNTSASKTFALKFWKFKGIEMPSSQDDISPMASLATDKDAVDWVCSRIQAWWRMVVIKREYTLSRFSIYHIAAMQIQYMWRSFRQNKYIGMSNLSPEEAAVVKIQILWRRYTNRRIYFYYRDLIKFRNAGDPALMLRCINPREAALFDQASGVHVRFRLGGKCFPPTILYKVFTHKPLCDVNAFAPRDYVKARQSTRSENNYDDGELSKTKSRRRKRNKRGGNNNMMELAGIRVGNSIYEAKYNDEYDQDDGSWYRRDDMNNWRPVTLGVLQDADMEPEKRKVMELGQRFHYSKVQRKQDKLLRQKRKKRNWMMKLYSKGLVNDKHMMNTYKSNDEYSNMEEDDDDLLNWTNNLDFDAYLDEWKQLGTSGPSNPSEYEKSVLESVNQRLNGGSGKFSSSRVNLGVGDNEILDETFIRDEL
jgi:hypothetical protein